VPTEKLRELVNIYTMEKYEEVLSKYIRDLQGF
jgi:hypothetical protein